MGTGNQQPSASRSNLTSVSDYARMVISKQKDGNGTFSVRKVVETMLHAGYSVTSSSGAIFRWSDPTDTHGFRSERKYSPRSGKDDQPERKKVQVSPGLASSERVHIELVPPPANGNKTDTSTPAPVQRGPSKERFRAQSAVTSSGTVFTGIPVTNKAGKYYEAAGTQGGVKQGIQYENAATEITANWKRFEIAKTGWFRTPDLVFHLADLGISASTTYEALSRMCDRKNGKARLVRTLREWRLANLSGEALRRMGRPDEAEEVEARTQTELAAETREQVPGGVETQTTLTPVVKLTPAQTAEFEQMTKMVTTAVGSIFTTPRGHTATAKFIERIGMAIALFGEELGSKD